MTGIAPIARPAMSATMRSAISGNWAERPSSSRCSGSRGDFAQAVHDEASLARYLDEVSRYYDAILMQPIVSGNEYRVFLLDDEVLYTARKYPPSVLGDGARPIRDLLIAHNDGFASPRPFAGCGRPATLRSMPCRPKGERWEIPGRMNLSAGGTMVLESLPSDAALDAGEEGRPRARASRRRRRPVYRYRRQNRMRSG